MSATNPNHPFPPRIQTRPDERSHTHDLCRRVWESEAEWPYDECMRNMVNPIIMDDDPGTLMRFAAWHTPHYVSRLAMDADIAVYLMGQVSLYEKLRGIAVDVEAHLADGGDVPEFVRKALSDALDAVAPRETEARGD